MLARRLCVSTSLRRPQRINLDVKNDTRPLGATHNSIAADFLAIKKKPIGHVMLKFLAVEIDGFEDDGRSQIIGRWRMRRLPEHVTRWTTYLTPRLRCHLVAHCNPSAS